MNTLKPKQAFAEAQRVIESRGMPKGKTVASIYDADRRGVTLRYYKMPRTYQRAMNKGLSGEKRIVVSDAEVTAIEKGLLKSRYVITYVLWTLKEEIKNKFKNGGRFEDQIILTEPTASK
jgi:hypothetical protein